MRCPKCLSKTQTYDSRNDRVESIVKRRRQCTNCGYRFVTIELPQETEDMNFNLITPNMELYKKFKQPSTTKITISELRELLTILNFSVEELNIKL